MQCQCNALNTTKYSVRLHCIGISEAEISKPGEIDTTRGERDNLYFVVCANWPFKMLKTECESSLNCTKCKECSYISSISVRWAESLGNLKWSAVYGRLFSLMNSGPCRQAVWVLHLTAVTPPLRPLSLKDDRGRLILLHLSTPAEDHRYIHEDHRRGL